MLSGLEKTLKRIGQRVVVKHMRLAQHLDMQTRLHHMSDLGFRPKQIIDIGAAKGNWAEMVATIWPQAQILGVEPNESMRDQLEATSRALPNFKYTLAFAGETESEVQYVDHGTSTSLTEKTEGLSADQLCTAKVRPLDDILAEQGFGEPDFMKLDVQGYELSVLRGAPDSLKRGQAVLIEVNFFKYQPETPLAIDVINFMHEHGYTWYEIMGALRRPRDGALGQMDLMFVKDDHPLRSSNRWSGAVNE